MASTGLLGFNPYGKAPVIDFSSKPTQLAIQLQQKEQAKAEALEKYFMDYEKSINPKGLGKGEQDIFTKKYNAAREYWIKNKEAITHPTRYGAEAQSTYLAALKDAQSYIEEGKQATAERKAFVDFINKQKAAGKHISDNYLEIANNAMKPVQGGYIAPDLSQIQIYDPHNEKQFYNNVWGNIKFPTEEKTIYQKDKLGKQTGYEAKQTIEQITPNIIQNVVLGAANEYRNNLGTKEHFDKLFEDKKFVSQINDIFKKNFDNKNIQNPEDLAIGYALTQKQPNIIKTTDFQPGYEKKMRDKLEQSMRLKDYGKDKESEMPDSVHIFDKIGGEGNPVILPPDTKTGRKYKINYGIVEDDKGNPATITTQIAGTDLPQDIFSILKESKLNKDDDYIIKSQNGKIVSIKPVDGSLITREYAKNEQSLYYGTKKDLKKKQKGSSGINWKQ